VLREIVESLKLSNFEKDFDVLIRNLGFDFIGRDDGKEQMLVYKDPMTNRKIYVSSEKYVTIEDAKNWKDLKKFDFLVKKYRGKWDKEDKSFNFNGYTSDDFWE